MNPDQIRIAKSLREDGFSWRAVAAQLGRSVNTVRRYTLFGPPARPLVRTPQAHNRHELSRGAIAERLATIPDDTRSLTARLCGDPLPGRSALEQSTGATSLIAETGTS